MVSSIRLWPSQVCNRQGVHAEHGLVRAEGVAERVPVADRETSAAADPRDGVIYLAVW
jgi:hypothetical protein